MLAGIEHHAVPSITYVSACACSCVSGLFAVAGFAVLWRVRVDGAPIGSKSPGRVLHPVVGCHCDPISHPFVSRDAAEPAFRQPVRSRSCAAGLRGSTLAHAQSCAIHHFATLSLTRDHTAKTLDRMTRNAVSRMFRCDRPWRAPRHPSVSRHA